jgi:hypothetical protein
MFAKYEAIKWQGVVSLLAVSVKYPGRLYWSGGSSYCIRTPDMEVLKEYYTTDFDDDEDALEVQYKRDFYPPTPNPVGPSGWLAPDGHFYGCEWGGHDSLAENITATINGTLDGTKALESLGWLRIQDGGIVTWGDYIPTQSQIDTMYDLQNRNDIDEKFVRRAKQSLSRLLKKRSAVEL